MTDREPVQHRKRAVTGCFPDGDAFPAGTDASMHNPRHLPSGWEAVQRHKQFVAEQAEYQRDVESQGYSLRIERS